jgi:hypothetical protein
MRTEDLAKKQPMAMPEFTVLTPKTETVHEKMIREAQEKQMADCCGDGYRPYDYDRYGYKPRPKNPPQDDSTPPIEQLTEPQDVSQTNNKNSKR